MAENIGPFQEIVAFSAVSVTLIHGVVSHGFPGYPSELKARRSGGFYAQGDLTDFFANYTSMKYYSKNGGFIFESISVDEPVYINFPFPRPPCSGNLSDFTIIDGTGPTKAAWYNQNVPTLGRIDVFEGSTMIASVSTGGQCGTTQTHPDDPTITTSRGYNQ